MTVIKIEAPSRQSPGYFRRMREGLKLRNMSVTADPDAAIAGMIEFILPYVTEPVDREQAREALWDASEEQIEQIMDAVVPKKNKDTKIPPKSGESLDNTTSPE